MYDSFGTLFQNQDFAALFPADGSAAEALSPRQASWLLVNDPEKLKPEEEAYRVALPALSPLADAANGLAQRFVQMLRDRDAQALDAWLADATASPVPDLQRFASSLRRDYAAVSAALKVP